MMKSDEILNEILENTKKTKELVVKKFEKKAEAEATEEKTPKQKAEAKFKMVGTKLNPTELEAFTEKIEALGLNTSQYFKKAVAFDFISAAEQLEKQKTAIDELERQKNELENLNHEQDEKIKALNNELKEKNEAISKEKNKGFIEKLLNLF